MDTYDGSGLSLLQMQDEVCKRCFKDTATFRAMVKNWINEAQQKINSLANGRWWWLETSRAYPLNQGDEQIVLPDDFFELIDTASVRDEANHVILCRLPHRDYAARFASSPGQPDAYTVFARDESGARILRVNPPSDTSRVITIDYYKVLPDLSEEDDISQIPYWYHYVLIEFAVLRGHEHRQQAEMASIARKNWLEGVSQLMVEADQRNDYQPQLRPRWRW
ncbi:MAG: hypothetical protein C4541_09165 [Candidatus Auribacter fodinae]|jgi:hypothetical protein|uniref:Uncharacterized protein n=1 Tax=Candidatus Auribacter fodinae TaxID=2093366 RepID=A0A3A4QYV3_9BACT|nr:MAG: hypothetical protein C4541_09165 [Candidatus Auribacter fodinae]